MKIFSNQQIRDIVRYTVEQEGIPEIELIQRAGATIAAKVIERCRPEQHIVVCAGWGDNGADALATTIELLRRGFTPEVILFNIGGSRLSDNCRQCRDALLEEWPDVRMDEVIDHFDIPELDKTCVVIDGLFGSGLDRALPQSFSVFIRSINDSGADIISIDVPSGLFGDWNLNSINNNIIHARMTLAIEFPRLAFFIDDNAELVGEWEVVKVGLSRDAMRKLPYTFYQVLRRDVRSLLMQNPRWPENTKEDYGSALICAGSYGMMGAAVLACRGCLRAGAGRVTCYSPRCGYYVIQSAVPSAMFKRDPHDVAISEITLDHDYQVVAIGPGIGQNEVTINALENFLKVSNANSRPLLLDADALNCIALRPRLLDYIPVNSVITPHAREFDRLFGAQPSHEARLRKAIEMATFYKIVIVLKGRYTMVVLHDGRVYINSSGSPALATAGTGDVLTGVIAGFMAQGFKSESASIVGVYVHGCSGLICEEDHGVYGTTSEDVAQNIGRAIKEILE